MSERAILLPALAMVALTIVVWFRMYTGRVAEMRRERIHPQSVATSAQMAARLTDTRASDNFRNLFELPVLFYVALLVLASTGHVTPVTLMLAWLFVALRVLHSADPLHLQPGVHRFCAYLAGWLGAVGVVGRDRGGPAGRMSDEATELRRLRWRCRRGMRELDQLLTRWLDREWRQARPSRSGAYSYDCWIAKTIGFGAGSSAMRPLPMSNSPRSSSTCAPCRLEWRPSRWVIGSLPWRSPSWAHSQAWPARCPESWRRPSPRHR